MKNKIGFVYIIEYIGENPLLQGLKYAGSKTFTKNWQKYLGSPSTKGCGKCKAWKEEAKLYPENFIRKIISYADSRESLLQLEIDLLNDVTDDIITDSTWLNNSIPRIGAFPTYIFTEEEQLEAKKKRCETNIKKYGVPYLLMSEDYRNKLKSMLVNRYGEDHYNKTDEGKKRTSENSKNYFSSLTETERKQHGQKSLRGRTKQGAEIGLKKRRETLKNRPKEISKKIEQNRKAKWDQKYYNRTEEQKRITSEKCRAAGLKVPTRWVGIKFLDTGEIIEGFLKDITKQYNIAVDGIMNRYNTNRLDKPIYSRTCKRNIQLLSLDFRPQSL
jgi:hypothetical protein